MCGLKISSVKIKIMCDIFEEIHNEFVNSEEFEAFLKEITEYEQKTLFF